MIIKKYHTYIIKVFYNNLAIISLVFLSLSFLLNIFEEIKFFEYIEVSMGLPISLTLLNMPTLFFELMPFVFLITSKFFFIYLYEKNAIKRIMPSVLIVTGITLVYFQIL